MIMPGIYIVSTTIRLGTIFHSLNVMINIFSMVVGVSMFYILKTKSDLLIRYCVGSIIIKQINSLDNCGRRGSLGEIEFYAQVSIGKSFMIPVRYCKFSLIILIGRYKREVPSNSRSY